MRHLFVLVFSALLSAEGTAQTVQDGDSVVPISLCIIQSRQFSNVIQLRMENRSRAEVSSQCSLNGALGVTDEGLQQYQIMQRAFEAEIIVSSPRESCDAFSEIAFEQFEPEDIDDASFWVKEAEAFWLKRCMGEIKN
ncbi:hypothetical protein E0F26_09520 [Candidatus Paraluminiphilus aquimaris]|uniref:DUF3019 domain-containing protein n=1 Tax=Candidatus Paraluminiphilus aquimaris TaxID=2518994 RepID=A0ABY6Q9S4_9GAMM|nr:hypothetical protein [Candidatus Paraluminiphilus aquimaris]UZP74958.1 hypothetical protein E0F26_09520 [Candidatus Paraluminiphilus aquimaris]